MAETTILKPQPGPQEQFLASPADIVIYGGAAGGGKSYALLLEPVRHKDTPGFGAVIFRRTSPQIRNEGGLWDTSESIYSALGATPKESVLEWEWPNGNRFKFAHMEHEKNKLDWQGSQIPFIGWDELTHFTESQFFYMLSRNRSTCGVRPYMRATTNPDADSWVAGLIDWWIGEDGYPIPERGGVIRWFVRVNEKLVWADSKTELAEKYADLGLEPKSLTFIPAKLEDNQILMRQDPGYRANLLAQSRVERERLLSGNWKVRPSAGLYFRRHYFEIVDAPPAKVARRIRYWDRAATKPSKDGPTRADWTAGVLMSVTDDGIYYVEDVVHIQEAPLEVERAIKTTASNDGREPIIGIEQDPGQAGKFEAQYYTRMLAGYKVRTYPVHRDKISRAEPYSAQAEAGNVRLVRGKWNDAYLVELENFPDGEHDDQVDASSGAFNALVRRGVSYDELRKASGR